VTGLTQILPLKFDCLFSPRGDLFQRQFNLRLQVIATMARLRPPGARLAAPPPSAATERPTEDLVEH
jgi:hypothetical protein